MISAESDMAAKIARKGLAMIDRVLDQLDTVPREDWSKTHVRDITECVMAAVRVQAEERAQAEFEKENRLTPEDVRALIKEYLASLPPVDVMAFFAEVRGGQTAEGKSL